ncbi:Guanine nucleotide-binding protein subunit gamma 3 [Zea mays]|uniref:GS3-like protein n=1 Tax=Zea mays TaxID=4577 RepID=D1GC39_MAIZE|nr:Guanine nucleotide-binding protein subunit gamma 3 [Zea mays]ACZ02400.1 GS3-like protein [Zea mays]ACZ02401.1 GS3-like protein [Zea mays]ONL98814.1 GS3-like protein [Zea mays]|eukprot:XP_020405100.1 GS3-like protein isoform X2 [Zea mays]
MAAAAAPRPKSPPASPDPCGRHRLQLAVDALHREIGFLEGEISSIEGVHAASRCCKEVDEFVGRNPDPFLTIQQERGSHDQSQQFLKKFRGKSCLSYYLSWICGGGWWCPPPLQLKRPPAPSCSCAPRLGKLCSSTASSCCSCCCCRFRVVYAAAGCGCCAPCPRCSCDCTCACPRCCSCACPMCSAACCAPRCCLCL